ncbi:MAG: cysteine-rich CWC family protein [Chitinivorax sp.]
MVYHRQIQALANHTCPLCGAPNQCAAAQAGTLQVACWCSTVPIGAATLARVPAELRNRACLCVACATAEHDGTGQRQRGCQRNLGITER